MVTSFIFLGNDYRYFFFRFLLCAARFGLFHLRWSSSACQSSGWQAHILGWLYLLSSHLLVVGAVAPIKAALAVAGIETRAWYCPPLHQQPAFSDCALASMDASGALANTERLASHSLGLPWHTRLSDADMARVTSTLGNILATPA